MQRYLPFWAANLVDRMWVILVPIIAVLVLLGRAVPALYRWRVRSRVFRWYARLKQIELALEENPGPQVLEDMLKRLDDTERAVNQIPHAARVRGEPLLLPGARRRGPPAHRPAAVAGVARRSPCRRSDARFGGRQVAAVLSRRRGGPPGRAKGGGTALTR